MYSETVGLCSLLFLQFYFSNNSTHKRPTLASTGKHRYVSPVYHIYLCLVWPEQRRFYIDRAAAPAAFWDAGLTTIRAATSLSYAEYIQQHGVPAPSPPKSRLETWASLGRLTAVLGRYSSHTYSLFEHVIRAGRNSC